MIAGSAGAVLIRVLFCVIIAWLMAIPAIKLIGGGRCCCGSASS